MNFGPGIPYSQHQVDSKEVEVAIERFALRLVLIVCATALGAAAEQPPTTITSSLGHSAPESTAELFAPGIISTANDETVFAVSGDGRFCYLSRSPSGFDGPWTEIPVVRSEHGSEGWSIPEAVGEPGRPWYLAYQHAEAEDKLFFAWTPTIDGSAAAGDIDIWVVTMTASGWSAPRRLVAPVNLEGVDSWPSIAGSGTLYFFSNRPGSLGEGDLYRAINVESANPVVEHLGNGINSPFMEHDPCVAPDESFLVFASDRPGGLGGNDLYVSYPSPSGDWGPPINLGSAVNSAQEDARPVLSDDGSTLFFTRQSEAGMDVFHVSTSTIRAGLGRTEFPHLSGPYLGQTPPGKTPAIFAPGIVSTPFVEQFAHFTPDGRELFFLLRGAPHTVILTMKEVDGRWTKPRVAPFSGQYFAKLCLSPDGNTVILDSNRPLSGQGPPDDVFRLWEVRRNVNEWTEPALIENVVDVGAPSMASNRNLYFYLDREGERDILFSSFNDGTYSDPVNLGPDVNSEHNEVDPFIAPDESYLLFCSDRPEGSGLYVSFRKQDGSWTPARNMGPEINLNQDGSCCPVVSPDDKHLFFTSNNNTHPRYSEAPLTYEEKLDILNSPGNGSIDIYWIDASVIQDLKPEEIR